MRVRAFNHPSPIQHHHSSFTIHHSAFSMPTPSYLIQTSTPRPFTPHRLPFIASLRQNLPRAVSPHHKAAAPSRPQFPQFQAPPQPTFVNQSPNNPSSPAPSQNPVSPS